MHNFVAVNIPRFDAWSIRRLILLENILNRYFRLRWFSDMCRRSSVGWIKNTLVILDLQHRRK